MSITRPHMRLHSHCRLDWWILRNMIQVMSVARRKRANSNFYVTVLPFLIAKGMVGSPYFAHFLLDGNLPPILKFNYLYTFLGLYNTSTAAGAQGAFDLITSTDENSWLAMISNGATMTSEMWNTKEKPNMSWSHPWVCLFPFFYFCRIFILVFSSPPHHL
jgi:hypothetical protein